MKIKTVGESRFEAAWSQLLDELPGFASLLFNLRIVPDASISTLNVDGKTLRYSPAFFERENLKACKFALCHEVLHCAFLHPFMLAEKKKRREWDHLLANIAGDYVVNAVLHPLTSQGKIEYPSCGCLYDDRFDSMEIDEVYSIISRERSEGKSSEGKSSEGKSSEGESSEGESSEGESSEGESSEGESSEGEDEYCDPTGHGGFSAPKDTDSEAKESQARWNEALQTAAQFAEKCGKGDSGILNRALDRVIVKEPWYRHLIPFLRSVAKGGTDWSRANRRYLHRGMYLPAVRKRGAGKVGFFIDTSGSISDHWRSAFAEHASDAIRQCHGNLDIYLLYFDTEVSEPRWIKLSDLPLDCCRTRFGGTSPECAFEHVKTANVKLDAIVVLTDMEFYVEPLKPCNPNVPVLWCYPHGVRVYARNVPFGTLLEMRE